MAQIGHGRAISKGSMPFRTAPWAQDLEYDFHVRRSLATSVLGLLLLSATSVVSSHAQIPTGNTGRVVTGTMPNVAGPVRPPTGPVQPPTGTVPLANPLGQPGFHRSGNHSGDHQHHHYVNYASPGIYLLPLPYAVDIAAAEEEKSNSGNPNCSTADQDTENQDCPAGAGPDSAEAQADASMPDSAYRDADAEPDPSQPTLLVFKDGHKLEVGNYAIVEQTLVDLTPGHARKVPLATLDLEATREENEDRGIVFQIPVTSRAD